MSSSKFDKQIDKIARECLAMRTRLLNRVITKTYNDALRPLKIKTSQMNILVAVGKMRQATSCNIGRHLHLDESTLSRNLDRMKSRGWLEEMPAPDARIKLFKLSSSGQQLLGLAKPNWQRAQRQTRQLLGKKGESILNELTHKLAGQRH